MRPPISKTVRHYALLAGLSVIFIIYAAAAYMKLTGDAGMTARMEELNFGGNWKTFIGVAELIGSPAIFIPKFRRLALLCLWPFAVAGLALHIGAGHERIFPGIIASLLIPFCLWLDGGLTFKRK